jgi:hypothetical protein
MPLLSPESWDGKVSRHMGQDVAGYQIGQHGIVPAPADIPGWEHSLTTGAAVADSLPGGEGFPDAYGHNGSEMIPLAIISNGERHPYSPEPTLSDEDQIIVLRRSGISSVHRSEELAAVDG